MPMSTWPEAWPSTPLDIPAESIMMRAVYGALIERMHVAGISHNISRYGVPDSGLVRRTGWYAEMSEAISMLYPYFVDREYDYAASYWQDFPRTLAQTDLQLQYPTAHLPSQGAPTVSYLGWLANARAILDRMTMTIPLGGVYRYKNYRSSEDQEFQDLAATVACLPSSIFVDLHTNSYPSDDSTTGMRYFTLGYYWDEYYKVRYESREMKYRHTRRIPAIASVVSYLGPWLDDIGMPKGEFYDSCGLGFSEGMNAHFLISSLAGEVEIIPAAWGAPDALPPMDPLVPYLGRNPENGGAVVVGCMHRLALDYAHDTDGNPGFTYWSQL